MSILSDEITNDPLGRGYAGMTDEQVADDLNTAYRTKARTHITAEILLENTNLAELDALTAERRDAYWGLISMGTVDVGTGTNARAILSALFGAGTTTRANLIAWVQATDPVTRAAELGIKPLPVKAGHVEMARS